MEQVHRRRWLGLALLAGVGFAALAASPGGIAVVQLPRLADERTTSSNARAPSDPQRAEIRRGFAPPLGPTTRTRRRVVLWDEAIVGGVGPLSEHDAVRLRGNGL